MRGHKVSGCTETGFCSAPISLKSTKGTRRSLRNHFVSRTVIACCGRIGWNGVRGCARIRRLQTRANLHANLTIETSVEVPVGKNKSKVGEPTSNWLAALDSTTLEQRLSFQDWIRWSGSQSLDDKHKEIIERGWLPIIRGEYKKHH
jgi:hypothetical protein